MRKDNFGNYIFHDDLDEIMNLMREANHAFRKMEENSYYYGFTKEYFDAGVQDYKKVIEELYEKIIYIETCIKEN